MGKITYRSPIKCEAVTTASYNAGTPCSKGAQYRLPNDTCLCESHFKQALFRDYVSNHPDCIIREALKNGGVALIEETYKRHTLADGTRLVCQKQVRGALWLVSHYTKDGVHICSDTYIHEWEALRAYTEIVSAAKEQ